MLRLINIKLLVTLALMTMRCSFVYDVLLDNQSGVTLEVIVPANIPEPYLKGIVKEKISHYSKDAFRLKIPESKNIIIGRIFNREEPDSSSFEFNFIEVIKNGDTLRFESKAGMLAKVRKVNKGDWRLIVD